jgi:hypothetical protein
MEHQWPQLLREFSVMTVAGVSDYALPSDFLEMVDQSGWNRTTRFPLGGPLSPQEWQFLKASGVGVVFNVVFRNGNVPDVNGSFVDAFRVLPAPAANVAIAFEYRSRAWAQVSGIPTSLVSFSGLGTSKLVLSPGLPVSPASSNIKIVANVTLNLASTSDVVPVSTYINGTLSNDTPNLGINPLGILTNSGSFTGLYGALSPGKVMAGDTWTFYIPWGQPLNTNTPQDAPSAFSDQVLFDHLLVVRALKLAWKKDGGFDTASAQEDYDKTLERVKGNLSSAPRLSLVGRSLRDRLIDTSNLPITGYGVP